MPIKVVNNTGGTLGTQILDVETEADLSLMVESLSIDFGDVNCVVRGTFVLGMVHCETKLRTVEWLIMDPISNTHAKVETIKFANGNVIRFQENGDVLFFREGEHVSLQSVGDGRMFKFRSVPIKHSRHHPTFSIDESVGYGEPATPDSFHSSDKE